MITKGIPAKTEIPFPFCRNDFHRYFHRNALQSTIPRGGNLPPLSMGRSPLHRGTCLRDGYWDGVDAIDPIFAFPVQRDDPLLFSGPLLVSTKKRWRNSPGNPKIMPAKATADVRDPIEFCFGYVGFR